MYRITKTFSIKVKVEGTYKSKIYWDGINQEVNLRLT